LLEDDINLVIAIFLVLLDDGDSYVYLCVVHALKTLMDLRPKYVMVRLINFFRNSEEWNSFKEVRGSCSELITRPINVIRCRALLAEAITFGIKRSGRSIAQFGGDIVGTCIHVSSGGTERGKRSELLASSNLWRPESVHILSTDSKHEENEKDESQTVRIATAIDSAMLQQSAVSLLAEFIATAGFGSSRHIATVLQFATDILNVEHKNTTSAITMRRCAVFLIKYIVIGLQRELVQMKDSGSSLQLTYRAIKLACGDTDLIVRFHAGVALDTLNTFLKQQLFLSERPSDEVDIAPIRILR
jgi:hypothetical protein